MQVAPLSLVPHPLKKEIFEEGLALAPLFGKLVQNISLDPQFLIEAHHKYAYFLYLFIQY